MLFARAVQSNTNMHAESATHDVRMQGANERNLLIHGDSGIAEPHAVKIKWNFREWRVDPASDVATAIWRAS